MPTANVTPSNAQAHVRTVSVTQPLQWLQRGWSDVLRCGWASVVHGIVMAGGGLALMLLAQDRFWLLAGSMSGFLVVAPILATGLYALSLALERGQPPHMTLVVQTWTRIDLSSASQSGRLIRFGLLLALAGTGWVLTSAALITLLSPQPIHNPADFIRHVVMAKNSHVFELWMGLGGIIAAPIFASSVVTLPLLLDRDITVRQAILTSWHAVLENPLPTAVWAAVLMVLTLFGFGTLMLGLVFVIPMLGHASWHAYRDLIDVSELAPAPAPSPEEKY